MRRGLFLLEDERITRLICIFFCFAAFASLRQTLLAATMEEIPLEHPVYRWIDNLQKRGHFGKLYIANRPYTREDVARYALELTKEEDSGKLDRAEKTWLVRIREEFEHEISILAGETENRGDFDWRAGFSGDLRGDLKEDNKELEPPYESIKFGGSVDPDIAILGEVNGSLQYRYRLIFVDRIQVDSDPVNDPSFRIRGITGNGKYFNIPQAYVGGVAGPVSILFGRTNVVWGGDSESALTISGISPQFDIMKYSVDIWNTRASAFLAFLDRSSGANINRYLYGHRVDWRISRWLQLGFSEVAVVTGYKRGIEFSYLNPLISYYLIQLEEGVDEVNTDVYSSVNWSIYPTSGLYLSGEFLVDDIYLVESEYNRSFPNQVAFRQVAVWSGRPMPAGSVVHLEYTRIGSFVYLHRGAATDYSHYGAPIGNPLGPDTDLWKVGFSSQLGDDIGLTVSYLARRRGENRLEPGVSAEGHRGDPFPTGVVERRKGIGVSLDWFVTDDFLFRGEFVHAQVTDLNNVPGEDDTISTLEVSLKYLLDLRGHFPGS